MGRGDIVDCHWDAEVDEREREAGAAVAVL